MAINFVCILEDTDDCELISHWAGMIRANCGFRHTCSVVTNLHVTGLHKDIKILRCMPEYDYFFIDLQCVIVDELDSVLLYFGYRMPGGAVINRLKYPLTESRLAGMTYFYGPQHGIYTFTELHVKAQALHPPENSVIIHMDAGTKVDNKAFYRQCTWAKAFYNEHIYHD